MRLSIVPNLAFLLAAAGSLTVATTDSDSAKDDIHQGAGHEIPSHSRHDWKLTFKKPYLYDNKTLPYWDLYGDAKLTPDYVRLSPNVAGSKGSMWAQQPNYHREWHAEFQAHISGTGDVGADGLAFWYTRERGQSGPILGSVDAWHGLGILIDSWDRDTDTANPYIFGVWDDGKLHLEGEKNKMGKILGGCYHDARNTQKPFWIKVVYHSDHHLQVFYDDNGTKWKQCFEAKDVDLPTGYYFGLSASTGDHPDDHDVLAFETYELNPPYKAPKHADHDMTYSEKLKAQHAHDHAEGMHDQDREKAAEKEYGGTHAGTTSAVANRHMEEIMHANHLIFGSLDKIHARLDAAKMGMNVQHDHLDKSNSYTLNAGSQHGREGSTYADEHHDMQSLLAKVADVAHEVTEVHETIAHHTAAENDYNIMSRISAIERQVDSLAKAVSLATENVRKHHGIIEEHVASGGGSGAGHFLRYLFIILTGQVLIAVGYASYQKYRTEGKKYI